MTSAFEKRLAKIESNQKKLESNQKKLEAENKLLKLQIIKLQRNNAQKEKTIERYEVREAQKRKSPRVKRKSPRVKAINNKNKSGFFSQTRNHHRYVVIKNYDGKVIERERYSKKTYDKNFQSWKKRGSFDKNIRREPIQSNPRITKISRIDSVNDKSVGKSKYKPSKKSSYRYVYTLKKADGTPVKKNGKVVSMSGKSANAKNKNINDRYSAKAHLSSHQKISDKHAKQSAEFNFFTLVAQLNGAGYDEDEGRQIANSERYSYEREIVWYE